MPEFLHQRHKPLATLDRPRELILVCAPLRSNVNLSRIVRAASCSGVTHLIARTNLPGADESEMLVSLEHLAELSVPGATNG